MKDILVSICVITYNHENYLKDCLEGILMQEGNFKYEILIHDDASTDNTQEIIKAYQVKYPDLIFPKFQKANQFSRGVRGINFRYNFPRAKGKYIALCEGDDYWTHPNKLEKQINFLEQKPDFALSFHNAKVIKEVTGKKKESRFFRDYTKITYDGFDVLSTWLIPTASILFRNIGHENFPEFTREFVFGDLGLQLALAEYGKFGLIDECMSIYRINDNSITIKNINKPELYLDNIRQLKEIDRHFKGKYHREIKKRIFTINCSLVNAYKKDSLFKQLFWFQKALINFSLEKEALYYLYNPFKSILLTLFHKLRFRK